MGKKDYILRTKAIKAVTGWETDPTDEELELALMDIPAADVVERPKEADYTVENALKQKAERRGRWIENEFGAYCSECGLYAYRSNGIPWKSNYCPICGSFNGEGGENEELQR